MVKRSKFILLFLILLVLSLFSYTSAYADNSLYLGGQSAGFTLQTEGALIVGISGVITENGNVSPADEAGIKVGDVILSIDGKKVSDSRSIEEAIKDGGEKLLKYSRDNTEILTDIRPAKDINGSYKLGIYVKNTINGIGTITYIKGNKFASLGHPVLTEDGELLNVFSGSLYRCNITGVVKGKRGKAGELKGAFINNDVIGTISKNTETGVYGTVNDNFFDEFSLRKVEKGIARPGKASIFSTVSGGEVMEYSISIIKTDYSNKDNKNFVIKIDDENLLEITNGIVQGMSGSPIIQDGKIVGAITHVFLNDPTRGFGIAIDKML